MRTRALALLAVGLLAVVAALTLSGTAAAQAGGVNIAEGNGSVLEGGTVFIEVIFGVGESRKEVHVTCEDDFVEEGGDECPVWSKTFEHDEEKDNCGTRGQSDVCVVEFPRQFPPAEGEASNPDEQGQPRVTGTWLVGAGAQGQEDQDTFTVHISSANTCYDGFYRRGEALLVTSSGHPSGSAITVKVIDKDRNTVVHEETRSSAGRHVAYDFVWRPGLNYPLGAGDRSTFEVRVESDGKATETETFPLRPGLARALERAGPGLDQPLFYERTESVLYQVEYNFPRRPPDCTRVPFGGQTALSAAQIDEPIRGNVNKVTNGTVGETREFAEAADGFFIERASRVAFNYTIPRDAEVTGTDGNPTYEIEIPQTELEDANKLEKVNSTRYEVDTYTIEPEFSQLQDEVERLETAEVVVNLTYADGSGLTPNDTSSPMRITWGPEDGGAEEREEMKLNHQRGGRWNASVEIPFDHNPLGDYTWEVQENEDNHGREDRRNRIASAVSDVVEVVGARPVIDFRTFVADERVNGTERTRTVHVNLHAEYKNGVPLNEDNVDPNLGGVQLNVHKKNEFGRTLAVDSLVMTPANDDGDWVRSFRVGRGPSQAPIGEWDIEVVARDDSDKPNENVTRFPFDVRPANLAVSPRVQPPALVDDETTVVQYEFRVTYPDGTLLTQRLVDEDRGGDLEVRLERVQGVGQDPSVEQTFEPRGKQGGSTWRVSIESDKLVPGNHFFNVTGTDVHGNRIGPSATSLFTVVFNGEFRNSTTPICPRLEGDESCEVQRGENVLSIFPGSQGDKGMQGPTPEIYVLRKVPDEARWLTHRSDAYTPPEAFENLTGEDAGNNHVGLFETSASTPRGTYQLFIEGRAKDDTGFVGFSQPFNITPIKVDREIVEPLPTSSPKQQTLTAALERQEGDVIDQAIARAGPVTSRAVEVTATPVGTFVRWTPDRTTPTGPATIEVEGRDVFGNPFEATLGPTQLQPLDIRTDVASQPDAEAARGLVTSLEAELTYEDGATFRPVHGEPEVAILDATGQLVDEGEARFGQGRWSLTWRPPPDTPEGRYVMEIGGRDAAGNRIETIQSRTFEVVPGRVAGQVVEGPGDVRRGSVATADFRFDTEIEAINVTVTTGTTELGPASLEVEDGVVTARFPTTRTTELVSAFFRVEGRDAFGNDLTGETRNFQINPMLLDVRFVQQPSNEIPLEGTVVAEFVIEYPDGTRMTPSDGVPLVGLFSGGNPQGTIENVRPRDDNPSIWRIEWDPPEDVRTGVPFNFGVSAIDQDQNEAPPESSNGFLITNPVVPDYLPTPAPGLPALIAALAAALALIARRRP